jgi:hypothetical protein
MQLSVRRYLWEGMGQPALVCLAFIVPALVVERLWNPVGWVPLGASVGGCWLLFAAAAWRWGIGPAERRRWSETLPRAFGLQRAAVTEARP